MADKFEILIQGALDESKLINNINTQLGKISSKINKIDIGLSPSAIKGLESFAKLSDNVAKNFNKVKSPKFDLANPGKEAKLYLDRINSLVGGLKRFNGEVQYTYDELGKVNVKVKDAEGLLKKYAFQWDSTRQVLQRTNRQNVNDLEIVKEKQLIEEQKIRTKLEQDFRNQINANLVSVQKYYNSQNQAIEKTIALRQKEIESLKKSARENIEASKNTEHWLNIQKQNFESGVIKFRQQREGLFDETELGNLLKRFKELEHTTPNVRKQVELLKSEFKRLDAKAVGDGFHSANKHVMSFGDSIKTAAYKMLIWQGVGDVLFSTIGMLKQLPGIIVEIDTRLTEMAKVMSTDTDFGSLMNELSQSANSYGRTITETQDSVIEFAKQGYEAAQAIELANTALLGANVTGMKTGEMAEYLTGVLAQFNMTAEQSVEVVNKINEVDNNYSVTSQGLAQSIAKAGETAQQFGVTLDELIGMTTAISTATRESGRVVGNSLKFMFPRLNSDKAIEALASIKINTKDVSGELRSATQIYSEVAAKWDLMSRAQRTFVAEALAGKFHITRFTAMMDQWSLAMDAAKTSQQSLFSSLEENRRHMQSLEAQISKTKSAGQELTFTLGEGGLKSAMSGVLGVATSFLKGLTEITQNAGILNVVLGTLLVGSLVATAIKVGSLSSVLSTAAKAMATFTASALANPFILIGTGIAVATAGIITYIGHQRQLQEEMKKVSETASEANLKFKELVESSKQIGIPTLQDTNDIETQIKSLDKLIDRLKEVKEIQKEKFGLLGGNVRFETVPQDIKDITSALGINITQFKTWDSLIAEVNNRLNTLGIALKDAKQNSNEYQAEQVKNAQTQLEIANNSKALVEEYKKLIAVQNKNEEQNKRLAEVKRILMSQFPEEWNNGNNIISLMEKEANQRIKLAESTVNQSEKQLIANRKSTQIAYETTVKNIALYQAEVNKLQELWNARANQANTGGAGDFRMLEGLTTAQYKLKQSKGEADSLAQTLKQIDDILNWKAAPVSGGGSSGSSKSKSSGSSAVSKEFKDVADAQIAAINNQVELDKKLEDSYDRRIKIAKQEKDYQKQVELSNGLLNTQIKIVKDLQTANDNLHKEADKVRSNSKFNTSSWFNAAGEASTTYINQYNKASASQQKEMQKTFDLLKKLGDAWNQNADEIDKYTDSIYSTKTEISNLNIEISKTIADTLEQQSRQYLDGLKAEQKSVLDDINDEIEKTEKYYDRQIEKQQKKLDQLDEQIQKEERLQKLREIDDEISKLKQDKRFEFITAEGERTLTYNTDAVTDLEKQKSDLLKDYENEDKKQSIENEIKRLEELRDEELNDLKSDLENREEYYNNLIEMDEQKWSNLIESATNGTLSFDELMNPWYEKALDRLHKYRVDVESEMSKIGKAFSSMGVSGSSSTTTSKVDTQKQSAINKISKEQNVDLGVAEIIYNSKIKKYHDGGIVGENGSAIANLINKFFNVKPGEKLIKALDGELMIPPKQMPNFINNIRDLVGMKNSESQSQKVNNYYISDFTVKANSMTEFIKSINTFTIPEPN